MEPAIIELEPPHTWDDRYGLELTEIYTPHFAGIWDLFRMGVSGMCLGREEPVPTGEIYDIANGVVARPNGSEFAEGELPELSSGMLECSFVGQVTLQKPEGIMLRGLFSTVIEDGENEGPGDVAVSVMSTLAANGYIPLQSKKPSFAMRDIYMQAVDGDILLRIRMAARKDCRIAMPVPIKDGRLDIELVKFLAESKR